MHRQNVESHCGLSKLILHFPYPQYHLKQKPLFSFDGPRAKDCSSASNIRSLFSICPKELGCLAFSKSVSFFISPRRAEQSSCCSGIFLSCTGCILSKSSENFISTPHGKLRPALSDTVMVQRMKIHIADSASGTNSPQMNSIVIGVLVSKAYETRGIFFSPSVEGKQNLFLAKTMGPQLCSPKEFQTPVDRPIRPIQCSFQTPLRTYRTGETVLTLIERNTCPL